MICSLVEVKGGEAERRGVCGGQDGVKVEKRKRRRRKKGTALQVEQETWIRM